MPADPAQPPPDPTVPATTAAAENPTDRGYEVTTRAWVVHATIFLAFALFLSMVTLLYVRWANNRVPNCFFVATGNERTDGIEIRMDGDSSKFDGPMIKHLSADNDYKVFFVVPAGNYVVTVSRDGRQLGQMNNLSLHDGGGRLLDVAEALHVATPKTSAASQPQ